MKADGQQETLPIEGLDALETVRSKVEPEHTVVPEYMFAGGSVGGQNLYVCDQCACVVNDTSTSRHTWWHSQINAVLVAMVMYGEEAPEQGKHPFVGAQEA